MKKCPACHAEVMENFDTCFACGHELDVKREEELETSYIQKNTDPSLIFLMVSLVFPLIGFIAYLMIKENNKDLAAQMILVITISVVFYAMIFFLMAFFVIAV